MHELTAANAAPIGIDNRSTGAWWKDAVFYEVYVDKFAENFAGFAKRLDYLQKLGITCIHLLPHYPSPMVDDGYDISDYRNVRPELGTLDDFQAFVREAHARGIRVMVDMVLNHISKEHPWFIEASASRKNPKRDYFFWSKTGEEFKDAENPFPDIKSSNWIWNEPTKDYYFSTFYPHQVDLNWDNEEVFAEMTGIMDFWAGFGVDGFRLDAVKFIAKRIGTACKNLPETHIMIKKIRAHLDKNHPGTVLLGEAHEPLETTIEYFGKGDECHLMYDFLMVEQMFLSILRDDRTGLEATVRKSRNIPESCGWAVFLRHHDEISLATLGETVRNELLDRFDPEKKYRFSTGASIRLGTMFKGDVAAILNAYRMLFGIPGSPIIYYGDEIGMGNGPLADGEKDTRKSVRDKFDWAKAIVTMQNPASLWSGIASLIKERAQSKALLGDMLEKPEAETLAEAKQS